MEINYIILAHTNPDQVKRLITVLDSPSCRFYLHIDLNSDILPFKQALQTFPNVFFLTDNQRRRGAWGHISIVEGTINALRQIIADNRTGYCVLLSGQDYPLKSNEYITSYFTKHAGTNFISAYPMPRKEWHTHGGMGRLNVYKIDRSYKRSEYAILHSFWNKEFYRIKTLRDIKGLFWAGKFRFLFKLFKKRKFPAYLKPYGGDQWWALPMSTVKAVLAFLDEHPDYLKYHQDSLMPDEIFFQSIIMSLAQTNLNAWQLAPSLTYVNWERENVPLPVTFKASDYPELEKQPDTKLFARKFDATRDATILNLLDQQLIPRRGTYPEED